MGRRNGKVRGLRRKRRVRVPRGGEVGPSERTSKGGENAWRLWIPVTVSSAHFTDVPVRSRARSLASSDPPWMSAHDPGGHPA